MTIISCEQQPFSDIVNVFEGSLLPISFFMKSQLVYLDFLKDEILHTNLFRSFENFTLSYILREGNDYIMVGRPLLLFEVIKIFL